MEWHKGFIGIEVGSGALQKQAEFISSWVFSPAEHSALALTVELGLMGTGYKNHSNKLF